MVKHDPVVHQVQKLRTRPGQLCQDRITEIYKELLYFVLLLNPRQWYTFILVFRPTNHPGCHQKFHLQGGRPPEVHDQGIRNFFESPINSGGWLDQMRTRPSRIYYLWNKKKASKIKRLSKTSLKRGKPDPRQNRRWPLYQHSPERSSQGQVKITIILEDWCDNSWRQ